MTAALILPPGVDPYDRAEVLTADFGAGLVVPRETGPAQYQRRERKPSLHTSERSATDWLSYTFQVPAGSGNSIPIAGQQPGRKSITLVCPSTSANSILVNSKQGIVDQGQGLTLPAGSSVTLRTEGEVWALSLGAVGTVGTLEYFALFDDVYSR